MKRTKRTVTQSWLGIFSHSSLGANREHYQCVYYVSILDHFDHFTTSCKGRNSLPCISLLLSIGCFALWAVSFMQMLMGDWTEPLELKVWGGFCLGKWAWGALILSLLSRLGEWNRVRVRRGWLLQKPGQRCRTQNRVMWWASTLWAPACQSVSHYGKVWWRWLQVLGGFVPQPPSALLCQ